MSCLPRGLRCERRRGGWCPACLTLACPKRTNGGCHGTLALRTAAKKHTKHAKVTVKLTKKALKHLRPGHTAKARVELTPRGGSQPTYAHKVKLRR